MVETLALIGFGIGIGWIASWFFAVRPLVYIQRDMRHAGFVHEPPPPPQKKFEPVLARNET